MKFIEETYLIIVLCSMINLQQVMFGQNTVDINCALSILAFLFIVIGYPISISILCYQNSTRLQTSRVFDKVGIIYSDLDLDEKGRVVLWQLLYSILRRLILGIVLISLRHNPSFQLFTVNF